MKKRNVSKIDFLTNKVFKDSKAEGKKELKGKGLALLLQFQILVHWWWRREAIRIAGRRFRTSYPFVSDKFAEISIILLSRSSTPFSSFINCPRTTSTCAPCGRRNKIFTVPGPDILRIPFLYDRSSRRKEFVSEKFSINGKKKKKREKHNIK